MDSAITERVQIVDYATYLKPQDPNHNPFMFPNDMIVISIDN